MMHDPRLQSMTIQDFRSIAGEWTIPLDAEVVLLHGLNGAGKTSVLSGLELAATGAISHLERADGASYKQNLHRRGSSGGRVEVVMREQGALVVGSATVGPGGIESSPLLKGRLADAFSERCFLPQTTLGRLLELYSSEDKQGRENSLIRFVKYLLGLDSLDALIDGLHPAGDLRRARKASAKWQVAEERLAQDRNSRTVAREKLKSARLELDASSELLVDVLRRLGLDESIVGDLATASRRAMSAAEARRAAAAALRESALQLDAIEAGLARVAGGDVAGSVASQRALRDAQAQEEAWWDSIGERVLSEVNSRADAFQREPANRSSLGTLLSALVTEAQVRDNSTRSRLERARVAQEALEVETRRLHEFDGRRSALEQTRATLLGQNSPGDVARVLSDVLRLVESETCPICDQDFAQGGRHESLHEYVAAKVQTLTGAASQLARIDEELSDLESLERQSSVVSARARDELLTVGSTTDLARESISAQEALQSLQSLVPQAEAAGGLRRRSIEAEQAAAAHTQVLELTQRLSNEIASVFAASGIKPIRGSFSQQVAHARARINEGLADQAMADEASLDLERLHSRHGRAQVAFEEQIQELARLDRRIAGTESAIAVASKRKDYAFALMKRAEEARSAIIARVFDEQLNDAWARLFRALVPSEPFVPRFKPQETSSRLTSVQLDTVDPNGVSAASPAAMLSYGNVNTAALSLFMALHFAVPAELPWLIFDDPVQSMDDLHVANFAAVVKQLTRRNGRQVVISVHQRELFEYLSLELAPGRPGESILAVSLERSYGRTEIAVERIQYEEDRAIAAVHAA
jgi:DNA repair protein SbcC/Rad50